jgi:4-aminobutyrate aminotransferase
MTMQVPADEVAAILVEPVLGEGGYIVPPIGFMQALQRLARKHDILLIVDEVQTGFGRTGKMFATEHFGLEPDVLIMAKGIASGFPISCIVASHELMSRWTTGTHGTTYGGNAVAAAAAVATLRVLREEKLVENAAVMGQLLLRRLDELKAQHKCIGDVRGLGLMAAAEFVKPDGSPYPELAEEIRQTCLAQRVILITCGPHNNIIRFIPPLIVTEQQVNQALQIFADALTIC